MSYGFVNRTQFREYRFLSVGAHNSVLLADKLGVNLAILRYDGAPKVLPTTTYAQGTKLVEWELKASPFLRWGVVWS
jgi:hypothetical protein